MGMQKNPGPGMSGYLPEPRDLRASFPVAPRLLAAEKAQVLRAKEARRAEGVQRAIDTLALVPAALFVVGEIVPDFKVGNVALAVQRQHDELIRRMREEPNVRIDQSAVEIDESAGDAGTKVACACALGQLGLQDNVIGRMSREAYQITKQEIGTNTEVSTATATLETLRKQLKRLRRADRIQETEEQVRQAERRKAYVSWATFRSAWENHFHKLCVQEFGVATPPPELNTIGSGVHGQWNYYAAVAFRYGFEEKTLTRIYQTNDNCGQACWQEKEPNESQLSWGEIRRLWHADEHGPLQELRAKRHAKLGVLGFLVTVKAWLDERIAKIDRGEFTENDLYSVEAGGGSQGGYYVEKGWRVTEGAGLPV
jgi:hypothetical protein